MRIKDASSLNFNDRLHPVDMLVFHYTGMESSMAAIERMQQPESEVSAHYLIDECGEIYQLVDEEKRAWHAGAAKWQGDTDLNSRSVGIEIANGGWNIPLANGRLPPYRNSQIDAVIVLSKLICSRHSIRQSRIVGHSDIAPTRKDDPGEHFPWEHLSANGIGLWPKTENQDWLSKAKKRSDIAESHISESQTNLANIGYAIEISGMVNIETSAVIKAFQRRFLQYSVTGELDHLTYLQIKKVSQVYDVCGDEVA